jgi:hypothetical protein
VDDPENEIVKVLAFSRIWRGMAVAASADIASKEGSMHLREWRPGTWLWLLLVATAVSFVSIPALAQGRRSGRLGVTVFTNPNFSGESATFRDDIQTLVPYGLNDKISSLQLPPGETWEVCQDVNYGNRCQVLSDSVSDFRPVGWNDRISSLRRVAAFRGPQRSGAVLSPGYSQALVIFDRPGFRGASRTVTGQSSDLRLGRRGGSVEVQGGGTWELCDRTGRCVRVNQNVEDVSRLGLNGEITSVRLLNDQRNNRRRQNPGWSR